MAGISPREYSRRLSSLTLPKIREVMYQQLKQDEQELKNLKLNELKHGEKPDGSPIGAYRSSSYEKFKRRLNPTAGGKVDLILKGDFSGDMQLQKKGAGRLTFNSRDRKKPWLIKRYGIDIMGLNQSTFNAFQANRMPEVLRQLKQYAKVR